MRKPEAARRPSYVLFCGTRQREQATLWRFVLRQPGGDELLEAEDLEPRVRSANRLVLLAAVRGLEALDQPSDVRLLTPHRYLARGLRYGMEQWRESNWMWEAFGEMVPIRNDDLWRRVDRAMRFHRVQSRLVRADQGHASVPAPAFLRRRRRKAIGEGGEFQARSLAG